MESGKDITLDEEVMLNWSYQRTKKHHLEDPMLARESPREAGAGVTYQLFHLNRLRLSEARHRKWLLRKITRPGEASASVANMR